MVRRAVLVAALAAIAAEDAGSGAAPEPGGPGASTTTFEALDARAEILFPRRGRAQRPAEPAPRVAPAADLERPPALHGVGPGGGASGRRRARAPADGGGAPPPGDAEHIAIPRLTLDQPGELQNLPPAFEVGYGVETDEPDRFKALFRSGHVCFELSTAPTDDLATTGGVPCWSLFHAARKPTFSGLATRSGPSGLARAPDTKSIIPERLRAPGRRHLRHVSQQAVSRRALGGFGAAGLATFIGEAPALAAEKAAKAPKAAKPKPLKDVALVKELFDSKIPAAGVMAWYDAHLSPDVSIEFNGGAVKLGKKEYLGLTQAILDSVPNLSYTAPKADFKKGKGNTVTWTAVVTGTHTGKPFSPLPKALQNDAEAITAYFDKSGEVITKFTVAAIPGGRASGPVGFYLQMGGDPKKLPKL
ncbi:hypothetical protein JL720_5534 [Aureococcus anophagefferens]|nr:hypothetical protein JL720_5534 [Aureococcus anophagefferens]